MQRRSLLTLALAPLFRAGAQTKPTAAEILDRVRKNVGVPWRAQTVDTVKAGDPSTPVTGVATTFAATFDVLQRASAAGKNLIIAHEPTFYNHLDQTADLEGDAVFTAKKAFIEKNKMVVFRFHDHWHARRPDGIFEGMTAALGWEKFRKPEHRFEMPEIALDKLASDMAHRMQIRAMRVIGDPAMKVTKVALMPGAAGSAGQIKALERDDVEVLVVGESREWETVEYARDAMSEGRRKALIVMGHVVSEEAGMEECARWLRGFVTEVPVEFIPAKEPFWVPR
jgi:putative NIF3 family GTP cyclohydrolase 1 type 2